MAKTIGFENADVVGNGIAALEEMKKREYDVILMDVRMPELGGVETTMR